MNNDFEKKLEHLKQGMIKIKTKYKIPDLINANQNSRRLSLIDLHKKYIEEKKEKDRIEEEKKKKKDLKKPSPKKYGSADIINQVIDQSYYEKVKQKEKEERLEKEKIEKLEKDRMDKDKVKLEDEKIPELKIKENEVSKIDIVKSKLESSAMEIDEEYNEQFIDFPKIENIIKSTEVIKYETKNEIKNDKFIKIKKVEAEEIHSNQNLIFTKKKSEPKETQKENQIKNLNEIQKESKEKENIFKEKIQNIKAQKDIKDHKEQLKDSANDFTKKDKIELSKEKECENKNVEMLKSKERPENRKDPIREKNGVNPKETSLKIEKAIQNQKEHSKSIISNINREKSNTMYTQSNNKFDSVKEALKDNNISTIREKEITPKESKKKSQSKPPLKKEEIKEIILDKKEKNKRIINDDDDLKDEDDYIILGSGDEKNCLNNNKVCTTKFKILLNDEDFKENINFKSDQFEINLNPNSNDQEKKVFFLIRI